MMMKLKMEMMMNMMPPVTPSDPLGSVSIAFSLFGVLMPKREKSSIRSSVGFAWVGHKHWILSFLESLYPFILSC